MIDTNLKQTIFHNIINEKKNILKYIKSNESFKIPEIINNNLKHKLRKYQEIGLENYIFLNQKNIKDLLNNFQSKNNHHLFHMATGSGKTMMIAATIIYLNNLGYKRFIFTTNQTNLISKTKLNLLPDFNSSKYEFKNKFIEINGNKINIKEVENFSKYTKDIEIIFTTIQNLHNKITENKENSINLNDIKDTDIVILADEAHHFQSKTKKQQEENQSWEDTIQKILNINPKNKLVEYTATMDLSNKNILDKYKSKLIFNYTLKSFREDGYSKEISLIQNNNKDERILQSILINQYRYEIALNNNINLIPKILFKSNGTIEDLKKKQKYILDLINKLNIEKLNELLNESKLSYIIKLSKYLNSDKKKKDFISLIKKQFNDNSSLIIHSKDKEKDTKLKIANNLDNNNTIRMIFAINILNEGWDVLTLFDIVKIDEIEKKTIKKSTTSEIQLIGRGARIFPYSYKNELNQELDKFKRKFDKNISHDLRLLEDMNFYSANDNDYINKIKTELISIGLKDKNDIKKKVIKVKPKNELSDLAQFLINKYVFTNKLEKKYNNNSLISDYDINIQISKDYNIKEENIIDNLDIKINNLKINSVTFKEFINDYNNLFILNYAINFISYFSMNNISNKFNIKTKKDLILNILNLENKISITIKNKDILLLSFNDKLIIIKNILNELAKQLERKRKIKIGSKDFNNKFKIINTFIDYSKKEDSVKISKEKIFYYDKISYDSNLELELYNLFAEKLNSDKYLVIRNEVGFKIFNPFTKENLKYITDKESIFKLNGEGFEPDFIVLKYINDKKIIQFFIEVKGEYLQENENNKWKEKLLKELDNNEKIIIKENIEYKILGLPFFTEKNINNDNLKKEYISKIKNIKN